MTTESNSATHPTIVFVHGAWADASSFAPQIGALQREGYRALVAPNPLRGLAVDQDAVANYLRQKTSGPVVLVAHSYGGMVITGATGNADVRALVYVDAYAPAAGESTQDLTNAVPGSLLNVPDPTAVLDFVLPASDAPQPEWDAYIRTELFASIFAAPLPAAATDVLAASQSPVTLAALGTGFSGTPAWASVPSWFFIGRNDMLLPAAQQRVMAERATGTIVEADAPHLAMLAAPDHVTEIILDAARSVA